MRKKFDAYIKNYITALANSLNVRSIQFIISASFMLLTTLSMLFVGSFLYNKFSQTAERNAASSTRQIIEQVNMNLEYYLKSMMEISNLLESNIIINKDLPNTRIDDQMNITLRTREDIVTLAVLSDKGEMLTGVPLSKLKNNPVITGQEWFVDAVRRPYNPLFSTAHVQNLFEGRYNWVVSLSRGITYNTNGKKANGVLLVDMNFRSIARLCESVKLGSRGYVYIADPNGNIVYHPQQQLVYMGLRNEKNDEIMKHLNETFIQDFEGEKRMVTVKTVRYTGWRIVGISYMDDITTTKNEISRYVYLILVLGAFFVVAISAFISSKISQPIKRLKKSMRLVEEGQFDINIDVKGEDEVVQLSKAFNIMVARIRQLMDQVVLEQEAKRKSDLNALQAQINPHFLYNTLDSIVWMAENEKSQDVITMVTSLARLFRISISRGRNIITVREELEHARNYLIIQKIRYKNKFKFEIEAQQEALECRTLKLILQPLIENAIYHGIEYMVDEGFIKITVEIIGDRLLIKVADNGLGIKPEKLENILSYESKTKESSGVGVKNVHERIQLCYGKEYGLDIESELEEGTTVKIWLPVVKEENQIENRN